MSRVFSEAKKVLHLDNLVWDCANPSFQILPLSHPLLFTHLRTSRQLSLAPSRCNLNLQCNREYSGCIIVNHPCLIASNIFSRSQHPVPLKLVLSRESVESHGRSEPFTYVPRILEALSHSFRTLVFPRQCRRESAFWVCTPVLRVCLFV